MPGYHRQGWLFEAAREFTAFRQSAQKTFNQTGILREQSAGNGDTVPNHLNFFAGIGENIAFERLDLSNIPRRQWCGINGTGNKRREPGIVGDGNKKERLRIQPILLQ